MKNIYKELTIVLGFIFIPFMVNAQEQNEVDNTPAALEKFTMFRLWHHTSNAAGSMLENH